MHKRFIYRGLLLRVDDLHHGLPDRLQGGLVDGAHIILHGMPELEEIAFLVVRDDVDGRDFGIFVDERVVVGYEASAFLYEVVAEA